MASPRAGPWAAGETPEAAGPEERQSGNGAWARWSLVLTARGNARAAVMQEKECPFPLLKGRGA